MSCEVELRSSPYSTPDEIFEPRKNWSMTFHFYMRDDKKYKMVRRSGFDDVELVSSYDL